MQNTFSGGRSRGRGRGGSSRMRKDDDRTSSRSNDDVRLSPLRSSDYETMRRYEYTSLARSPNYGGRSERESRYNSSIDREARNSDATNSSRGTDHGRFRGNKRKMKKTAYNGYDSRGRNETWNDRRQESSSSSSLTQPHSNGGSNSFKESRSQFRNANAPMSSEYREFEVSSTTVERMDPQSNDDISERLAKLRLELCLARDDLRTHELLLEQKRLAVTQIESRIGELEKTRKMEEEKSCQVKTEQTNKEVESLNEYDETDSALNQSIALPLFEDKDEQEDKINSSKEDFESQEMARGRRSKNNKPVISFQKANSDQPESSSSSFPPPKVEEEEEVICSPIIAAEKLQPAKITNNNRVELLTNFWDINVENHIVYRYDVSVDAVLVNAEATVRVPLTGKKISQAVRVERSQMCLAALRIALQAYAAFRNITGTVYDGQSLLYCSEELQMEKPGSTLNLEVPIEEMPQEVREIIRWSDINRFELRISASAEQPNFNIADFSKESGRDVTAINKTCSQFLNLLTNQSASLSGYTVFGDGKIFDMKKHPQPLHNGQERREGAYKGIKFIEGGVGKRRDDKKPNERSAVPALLLDSKCGTFFTNQCILKSLNDHMGHRMRLNWPEIGRQMQRNHIVKDESWNEINRYVKGLRFMTTYSNRDYTISGISTIPLKSIQINSVVDKKMPLLEYIGLMAGEDVAKKCNPDNPAIIVKMTNAKKVQHTFHFAMETVVVMPNQRVPISKLGDPPRPIRPQDRWDRIRRLIKELNLEDGGSRNEFLKMFGVSLSVAPKRVTGIRRTAPNVIYNGEKQARIDQNKCNWSGRDSKAILAGNAPVVIVAYDKRDQKAGRAATIALQRKCEEFGLKTHKWMEMFLDDYGRDMKDKIMSMVKTVSSWECSKNAMIIMIDSEKCKSHDILKLAERKYLIITQHLTLEKAYKLPVQHMTAMNFVKKMNVKLGGLNYRVEPEIYARNKWIANDSMMIMSYDVAHPGKVNVNDVVMQPSVVGFSFNGGVHREAFVGDFHYQFPKLERVDGRILNERTKWMLELYIKNRKSWPKSLLVIRDGVSEGQYQMVMNEELEAIKEACMEYGNLHGKNDWCPPTGLAIVTKRHLARLLKESGNRVENVQPLTAVDRDITRANINEAYIVSSHALQGTARPICYQLLKNDLGFKDMDEFEAFMIALSFHHQISDMPISLPEPVYQADEWAKRGNNLWKGFEKHYNISMNKETRPFCADFEKMTSQLAFWRTPLCDKRINA